MTDYTCLACDTMFDPALTFCPRCGRMKKVNRTLGDEMSEWEAWYRDFMYDRVREIGTPETHDDFTGDPFLDSILDRIDAGIDERRAVDISTGNASIDAFLNGMKW